MNTHTQTHPTDNLPSPVYLDLDEAPEHTGVMAVLSHHGDTKIVWDYKNDAEVEAARASFDSLREQGYLAYSVSKDGSKGEVIREFDPKAEKIILSPPMVGG